jgi:FixJ family two-component response regulator
VTSGSIAIVDDDPSVRKGISRLLRISGFEVLEYGSGDAFLRSVAASRPDCAIIDIHLGGRTGIELRTELESTSPGVPVIFMTADEEAAARVNPCLTKPFTKAQLLSLIHEVLSKQ